MSGAFSIPILPARDLVATRAFYERMGFEAGYFAPGERGYLILARGGLRMHFFQHAELDPFANYAGCYWRVKDADALHAELARLALPARSIPRLEPPGDKPWGLREFALVDPDGNLVRVGHVSTSGR